MEAQEFTAADTTYTTVDAGTVDLAGSTFKVEVQNFHSTGDSMTWLIGARGGVYFLRAYRGDKEGRHQVISWKSGMPWIKRGNAIEVTYVGDQIEEAK